MESSTDSVPHVGAASKRLARQALVVCENRLEILLLEIQEERQRLFHALWLGVGIAVFGLLTGIVSSLAIVVACWQWSPLAALLMLAVLYASLGALCYLQLARLRRDWHTLPATFDELRKDRECLAQNLQ